MNFFLYWSRWNAQQRQTDWTHEQIINEHNLTFNKLINHVTIFHSHFTRWHELHWGYKCKGTWTPGNKSYIVFCSIIVSCQYWNLFSFTYKNQEEFLFVILSGLTPDLPSPVPWVPLYRLGGSGQSVKLTIHLCLLPSLWVTVAVPFCLIYAFTVWYLVIEILPLFLL